MRGFVGEEKGLFTFYREQQSYQEELERKKSNQFRTQQERPSQSVRTTVARPTKDKNKNEDPSECLKTRKTEEVEEKPPSRYRQRAYGNSVIIINRKTTEDTHSSQLNNPRRFEREESESKGRYLQNKEIQLKSETPQQTDSKSISKLGQRKRSYRPKRRDERQVSMGSTQLVQTPQGNKLPALPIVSTQQSQIARMSSKRYQMGGSALRFQGGKLLRDIRSSLKSEADMHGNNSSVSYIDYSRQPYISERRPTRAKLSPDKRRIFDLLEQYRRS